MHPHGSHARPRGVRGLPQMPPASEVRIGTSGHRVSGLESRGAIKVKQKKLRKMAKKAEKKAAKKAKKIKTKIDRLDIKLI